MRARKYNKRIGVWQTSKVPDGAGGNTVSETILFTTWCNIKTLDRVDRSTNFGITDTNGVFIVQLRDRADFDYNSKTLFFKYRSDKYFIQNSPVNINFEDREIQITVKRDG